MAVLGLLELAQGEPALHVRDCRQPGSESAELSNLASTLVPPCPHLPSPAPDLAVKYQTKGWECAGEKAVIVHWR